MRLLSLVPVAIAGSTLLTHQAVCGASFVAATWSSLSSSSLSPPSSRLTPLFRQGASVGGNSARWRQQMSSATSFDVDLWQSGLLWRDPTARNNQADEKRKKQVVESLRGTCFESYWRDLPSIVASATLTEKEGESYYNVVLRINGHSVQGRFALYQFLMAVLCDDDDDRKLLLGTQDQINDFLVYPYHWLWGYANILDWQHRSGRLRWTDSQTTKNIPDGISTESWWGYMNLSFSACILVGAHRAGALVLPPHHPLLRDLVAGSPNKHPARVTRIEWDSHSQFLLQHDKALQACTDEWESLFSTHYRPYVQQSTQRQKKQQQHASNNKKKNLDEPKFQPQWKRQGRFMYRRHVWKVHTRMFHHTGGLTPHHLLGDDDSVPSHLLRSRELLQKLPLLERNFALGWCRIVEILASATLPTDLWTLMMDGSGFLPLHIVDDNDNNDKITAAASSPAEARRAKTIEVMQSLLDAPRWVLTLSAAFWKRVSRTEQVSRLVPALIRCLTDDKASPVAKIRTTLRVFSLFWLPRSWRNPVDVGLVALLAAPIALRLKWKPV